MHTVSVGQCSTSSNSAAEWCNEQHRYVSTPDTQCLTHLDRKNFGKDSQTGAWSPNHYFVGLAMKTNTLCKMFVVITSRILYDIYYTSVKRCRFTATGPRTYIKQPWLAVSVAQFGKAFKQVGEFWPTLQILKPSNCAPIENHNTIQHRGEVSVGLLRRLLSKRWALASSVFIGFFFSKSRKESGAYLRLSSVHEIRHPEEGERERE